MNARNLENEIDNTLTIVDDALKLALHLLNEKNAYINELETFILKKEN